MRLREKFEELANGGKLRVAYRQHEVHIYKEQNTDLCGLIVSADELEFKSKKYSGVILSTDSAYEAYLISMTAVNSNLSIYSALAEFVLERLTRVEVIDFETIHGIIEEWRIFIQGGSQKISPNIQIGLFGELLFLQEILERKNDELAVVSWTGPDKSKVDFTLSVNNAVEIKSSKDPLSNEVSISSLEQLSSSFEFHFLRRYGLVETLEGLTIKDLYYSIYSKLSDFELKDTFRAKTVESGFNPYGDYEELLKLENVSTVDYNVQDYSFPKIIPPLHEKVVKLQYTINLDSQEVLDSDLIWQSLEG